MQIAEVNVRTLVLFVVFFGGELGWDGLDAETTRRCRVTALAFLERGAQLCELSLIEAMQSVYF